ncbi:uncharacterized protein PHALS_06841 [Plasmopara halstedii]|uniref:Uncharacterized protein n=1 Tax=Plasmopara halstedii TaxID=4781 RepID=A0A0P1B2U9_PLAHL|nr:uncharacterized protein PHALS_06841 [Plasmopara halstedii]CEG49053.1 hypothetical protein PHALS_06841 [Plasmopara halstedii]|eukprot:XP_024585422.1 hypothetical protein PHALS_06841 [Plasmopara halstedii]
MSFVAKPWKRLGTRCDVPAVELTQLHLACPACDQYFGLLNRQIVGGTLVSWTTLLKNPSCRNFQL